MSNKKDASDLTGLLARAMRDFAQDATQADQTIANHLAKELEENDNVRLTIELKNGHVRLNCAPIQHVVRRKRKK